MKLNRWIILGAMLSTTLLAQQVTNAPPAAPLGAPAGDAVTNTAAPATVPEAGATNAAPGKAAAKKKSTRKKAPAKKKEPGAELKTVPLVAGPALVDANHVNVRAQPKLNSEVVTRLTNGQPVTVMEEIIHNNSGPQEPSAWAKILLPPNAHVWVKGTYIDENKAVKPKKLNLRAGPGENYSVLGRLQRGDTVNQLNAKGDWIEIEPPTNAYAFVAAQYLKQEAPGAVAAAETATPATVTEPPVVAAAPTETQAANAPATEPTNTVAETEQPATAATATEEPPPKRIVQREGVVRGTFSIQAPTHFELVSPENGKPIDFLYTPSPLLDLRRYKGLRIIVTGEEGLEERWGNTPMLTIQKIQVLE